MDWYSLTLWIVCGGVFLALLVASIVVIHGNRKARIDAGEAAELGASIEAESAAEAALPPDAAADELLAAGASAPEGEAPDVPEAPASRLVRLRRRLSASENPFARGLLALLAAPTLDDAAWDDLEASLITSDLGVGPTQELLAALRSKLGVEGQADPASARAVLRAELLALVDPSMDRSLNLAGADGAPAVVLVVGVNGTGKTTTIGKLARMLVADGRTVVLGAADTFRAAAADQLTTWGDRVGVPVVRGPEGGDPASVAFDAVGQGVADGVDVVVVDTAGRLHTKTGLMDELGKVKRVIGKKAAVTEVLLVLDATTGQNGLTQARVFAEVVDVTGIALTKLDGSAKGGIVVSVQRELGVPVKLIGLGEGPDDLAPFDAETFVDALLAAD